jgi:hypothetical protein
VRRAIPGALTTVHAHGPSTPGHAGTEEAFVPGRGRRPGTPRPRKAGRTRRRKGRPRKPRGTRLQRRLGRAAGRGADAGRSEAGAVGAAAVRGAAVVLGALLSCRRRRYSSRVFRFASRILAMRRAVRHSRRLVLTRKPPPIKTINPENKIPVQKPPPVRDGERNDDSPKYPKPKRPDQTCCW